MLKYELEREKLATELEEERRSQKERDQCIKEQQMKIHNLRNLVTVSDSDRSSSHNGVREGLPDESTGSHNTRRQDAFNTPCFKGAPNVFVAKRSQYSSQPECSPLPDMFGDFADEDTWVKMNKGYIADLDSLLMTPSRKVQSFPISEDNSMENYNQEIQNLQRQLEIVIEERDEFKRKYTEQVSLSDQLTREISEHEQEILLTREVQQKLLETVTDCRGIQNEVSSIIQNFIADEKSTVAQILSTTDEVGTSLFSTLESHLMMAMEGKRPSSLNDSSVQEQCNMLHQKLRSTISSLISSDGLTLGDVPNSRNTKGTLGGQIACWKQAQENEVEEIKCKYNNLEKDLEAKIQLLEVSEGQYHSLEQEFLLVKKDRDAVLQRSSSSSQMLQALENEVKEIQHKYDDLQKELEVKHQLAEVSKGQYHSLERELLLVKEERDAVLQRSSSSSQMLQALENEVKEIKYKYSDLEKEMEDKNKVLKASEEKMRSLERELCLVTEDRDAVLQRASSSCQTIQILESEVKEIKHKHNDLEKELEVKSQLLEVSEGKYHSLEREIRQVTEDRDAVLQRCSSSSQMLQTLENELKEIELKCSDLEKELEVNSQLLEVSEEKYHSLEREFCLVTEGRDAALQRTSSSSHMLQASENEVKEIKQKYSNLQKELEVKNQLLKVSQEKYHGLEREFRLLEEDRDAVLHRISSSSQILSRTTGEKERVLKDLNTEVRRRKELEEEIKKFSVAFACRQRSATSFHSVFKSVLETMKAQNLTSLSNSHGS